MQRTLRSGERLLLALDGRYLSRELQGAALRRCVQLGSRLDILLVNPPQASTFLLAILLLQLEHSGIDYRLSSVDGDLGEVITRYLRRYRGISTIIVADLEQLPDALVSQIESAGHRFSVLSAPVESPPVRMPISDTMTNVLYESTIQSLPLIHKGKVRDIYAVDDKRMLIVTTDRLSAFDVVLPTPIPGKGQVLTAVANFWFEKLKHILPNQLTGDDPESVVSPAERDQVTGRAIVVKRLKALPVEAIVRGYLAGSGWADYKKTGQICGIPLPDRMQQADRLPEPLFTPSTKAAVGEHDENIDFERCQALLGKALAAQVRDAAIALYKAAAEYALTRGIIIADTKFEFGLDEDGTLTLIDEVLTPDSSRFWPADQYRVGENPPSYDKQYVRDWLTASGWNKQAPGPVLPPDVVAKTAEKYQEALRLSTN